MKHAGPEALDGAESLLSRIRAVRGLTERKRGVFYRGSRAFLHFHEDPAGLYADVRLGPEFVRLRATTQSERRDLLRSITAELG